MNDRPIPGFAGQSPSGAEEKPLSADLQPRRGFVFSVPRPFKAGYDLIHIGLNERGGQVSALDNGCFSRMIARRRW